MVNVFFFSWQCWLRSLRFTSPLHTIISSNAAYVDAKPGLSIFISFEISNQHRRRGGEKQNKTKPQFLHRFEAVEFVLAMPRCIAYIFWVILPFLWGNSRYFPPTCNCSVQVFAKEARSIRVFRRKVPQHVMFLWKRPTASKSCRGEQQNSVGQTRVPDPCRRVRFSPSTRTCHSEGNVIENLDSDVINGVLPPPYLKVDG